MLKALWLEALWLRVFCMGWLALSWSAFVCRSAWTAELHLDERTKLVFASASQAAELLSQPDDFVERMSPFDRSARLKTDKPVDQSTFLAFAAKQSLVWTAEEETRLTTAFDKVKSRLVALQLDLPEQIWLIKTTGLEEGGAAYTRGSAIVFPRQRLVSDAKLDALLCHELFHVLSRHDRELRERLYATIGFKRCGELRLPDKLRQRRLTNPDGAVNDHCIKINVEGSEHWAIPILYSKADAYDPVKGGEFFDYLTFQFIVINPPTTEGNATAKLIDGQPLLVAPNQAGGFMDQVGRNTKYIIHPDEILADNFVLIVTEQTNIASPEVLARIGDELAR